MPSDGATPPAIRGIRAIGGFAVLLLLSSSPAAAQDLRAVPLDHWTYPLIDAMVLRRPELGQELWLAYRPWRAAEIDSVRGRAERFIVAADVFESAWVDLLAAEYGSPGGNPEMSVVAGEAVRIGENPGSYARPPAAGPDEGYNEVPVAYYNVVSAHIVGSARSEDASFDPAFRSPAFDAALGEPQWRALLRHDFAVQVRDRFLLGWRYAVDTNIRNDPTRRTILGIRRTEAAFEVLDAYATVRGGPVSVTIGRAALSLGPGRAASPFVSESIPALDQIRLEVGNDPVRFTTLVAQLSRERPNRLLDEAGNTIPGSSPSDSTPVPFDVTRFLYLHRVDWRVMDHLQLAISEAAVVTGVDRGLELRFANPLIPFYLTQQEDDEADASNVNVVVNLEAVYTGLGKSRLYGDLFVQELFIDADKREEIGNQLAWRLGAEWADPLGWIGGSAGAEYTRADVFMYLHRGLNTNWTSFGVPLGSTMGPDADQLLAWTDWWLTPTTMLTFDVLSRRNGERSVTTLESVIDAGNPAFPSGVVQREWRVGAELWGFLPDYGVEGRLRVGRREVKNIAHERGRDGVFWEALVGLAVRLRLP